MKKVNVKREIVRMLEDNPPHAKSLVMTVFGDAVLPHGGTIWLGSLIELLMPLGINDRLVRTSVFRLAEEGWLESRRAGRRSSYAIKKTALARFERAHHRIYASPDVHWQGKWCVLMATDALDATERGALRKELQWQGYFAVAPGVFVHPAGDIEVLQEIIERVGVEGRVFVSAASDAGHAFARPLADLIGLGWDLQQLGKDYAGFIATFAPILHGFESKTHEPETAFTLRTLAIHSYRRIQLHDPQLPIELLPKDWPGQQAYTLCRDLYQACQEASQTFVLGTLRREDSETPEAGEAFYRRFAAEQ